MQPRNIGMTINHYEIEHILQQMTDVLRNAAYAVANERYPVGHAKRDEFFAEDGTLLVMDETSIKALLKDALDHYLQFNAVARGGAHSDFNYYLSDSFALVNDYVNNNQHIISFLSSQFAQACGILASTLAPVIEDLSATGHTVEQVESFTLNDKESYYLVKGENPDYVEGYDPKEDDLSTVDTYQSPEELRKIQQRADDRAYGEYSKALNNAIDEAITNGERPHTRYLKNFPTGHSRTYVGETVDDGETKVTYTITDLSNVLVDPIGIEMT